MAVRQSMRRFLRAAGEFIYPPACLWCRQPLPPVDAGSPPAFCELCLGELWPEATDQCCRCGAPVGPHLAALPDCHRCRDDSFRFESVVRFGLYDGALRRICLAAKRPRSKPLIKACAGLLWERSENQLREFAADALVPVPQHWTTRLRRRHNTAEFLARFLGKHLRVPVYRRVLRKTRRTPRQSSLVPTQRRTNLRRAFAAKLPPRLRNSTLLLVDDILTTGSTAHESARALRDAGAKRVFVAVLARGIGHA